MGDSAAQMYELMFSGFLLLGAGALVALVFWMLGVKSIPGLAIIGIGAAALIKFVIAPYLGFDL